MIKILIAETNYNKKAKKILASFAKVKECIPQRKELIKIVDKFDILIVRLDVKVDKAIIDRAKHLKIIATSTTGLDHIDVDYAYQKGIKVVSLRGEIDFLRNVWATAEHTFALILSLIRKIPFAFDSVKSRNWKRNEFMGSELREKTLGIIGFGRLGFMVSKIAQGFGMQTLAYDPYVANKKIAKAGVIPTNLNKLLKEADIITVHVSLNKKTFRLIGKKEFQKMKNNSFFVNTSRGQIIDERVLLNALRKKEIAGAALDVIWGKDASEIFLRDNPLVNYAKKHSNLIITPHIGGTTRESIEKTEIFIARKIKKHLDNYR